MVVQTRFATGRAMFIHWMFSNRALGEQLVHRATRMAGGNGRQVASRKLQAGGGYGTIGQQTERLQPGSKGRALLNTHRQEEISEQHRSSVK
jgi:hypothetical protein